MFEAPGAYHANINGVRRWTAAGVFNNANSNVQQAFTYKTIEDEWESLELDEGTVAVWLRHLRFRYDI